MTALDEYMLPSEAENVSRDDNELLLFTYQGVDFKAWMEGINIKVQLISSPNPSLIMSQGDIQHLKRLFEEGLDKIVADEKHRRATEEYTKSILERGN